MKAKIETKQNKGNARWHWRITITVPDDMDLWACPNTMQLVGREDADTEDSAHSAARRVAKQLNLTVEE